MAKNQEANTWSPEEIAVGRDLYDYKDPALDPKYKHLFESVMAQLTTFDIERGDDAAETFLSILQPAEIRHFLKRLVYEEALHTRSYRYIIDNLGIPLEIYDRWHTVDAMRTRVEMAQSLSEPVEKLIGKRLLSGTPYHLVIATAHAKRSLLLSMIFWFLIFEGVWFWINLCGPIQQLSKNGKFMRAAEQFSYIARDENSHIAFGVMLIKEFISQHPECISESFLGEISGMVKRAIALEDEFIRYCLKDGPILGYSAADHISTAKFFANVRVTSVGLPVVFPETEAQHRFPWMSEQMDLLKEKNFFETRVTEYQVGGALSFNDDDDDDWHITI